MHASDAASILALPAARRRQTYEWLTKIAAQYGIRVHVCSCKNPDITSDVCNLAGRWSPPTAVERQLALFVR